MTDTLYVINMNGQSMSVIDGVANKVTATVTSIGPNPDGVAVNPVTHKIYIADASGGEFTSGTPVQNLTVVDGAANTVTSRLAIGGLGAISMAVNSKTNTVYEATGVSVAVVDGVKDTLIATPGSTSLQATYPNFYGAFSVAVDESTNTVYVANESASNGLTVINGSTNTVTTSIPLYVPVSNGVPVATRARHVAVNPVSHMVYVAMYGVDGVDPGVLTLFNSNTNAVVGTVSMDGPAAGLTVNPSTGLVYTTQTSEVEIVIYHSGHYLHHCRALGGLLRCSSATANPWLWPVSVCPEDRSPDSDASNRLSFQFQVLLMSKAEKHASAPDITPCSMA